MQSFEEAREQLLRLAHAMSPFIGEHAPVWTPDSPAAAECATDAAFADSWGERPVQQVLVLAHTLLYHVQDHLMGLAHLCAAGDVVLAPLSLTRPLLTSCGRGHYLLAPDVPVLERLRRGMNLLLDSYVEQANLSGDRTSPGYQHCVRRLYAIRYSAARVGLQETPERRRRGQRHLPARWLGDRPPSEMALVADLLEDVEDDVPGGTGRLLYRMGSAFVHAQPHALAMMLQESEPTPMPEVYAARVGVSLQSLATWTAGGVYGTHLVMARAAEHFGWDRRRWNEQALPVLAAWRTSLP